MSLLPASIKRIRSKTTEKKWRHHFPHYKSMGAFCCHGNQSFDPLCPKTLCSLSPTPLMLHIKFDQDWPTGFRDIQVWKCEQRWTTTDNGRWTDDAPLVYYKLTLWAFGSGELKTKLPWLFPWPVATLKVILPIFWQEREMFSRQFSACLIFGLKEETFSDIWDLMTFHVTVCTVGYHNW